ncbi:ABC transporter ATP-binding protein [Salicibibacter cibi]|uniref:ABC transporter ATP-binding protein n=1 Tax=Salicibibacter cibi TaxID=2743001 RepID=A0A7T6ZDZ1_9BACI|nr:ABC transporter ATP-binding protein [Salicibibacter cibi]QQK81520.1 ABC transporter ATP-binding protein [Salicibibacter cibi]
MTIIECKDVAKSYKRTNALNGLSMTIDENKIVGLVGRNGAGKTTLMKIIAGFLRETSGEVNVFSKRPFNNLFVSENTIFIDEDMHFPTTLTVADIMKEAGNFYGNWDGELAEQLILYFDLDRNQRHKHLSKGQRSTFNMVLGIAARCPLTILDEPTNGMDAAVRKDMYRALLKDYIAYPRTMLLSSHHLEEIEDILEEVVLMDDGEKSLHMSMEDLQDTTIGFTGKEDLVYPWLIHRDILYAKKVGPKNVYVVARNDFSTAELQKMKQAGIHLFPISASDACVYLTAKTTGGIDDVFD